MEEEKVVPCGGGEGNALWKRGWYCALWRRRKLRFVEEKKVVFRGTEKKVVLCGKAIVFLEKKKAMPCGLEEGIVFRREEKCV